MPDDTDNTGSPGAVEIFLDPETAERLQDAGGLTALLDFHNAQPEEERLLYNRVAYTDEDWREHCEVNPELSRDEEIPPERIERRRLLRERVTRRWQQYVDLARFARHARKLPCTRARPRSEPRPRRPRKRAVGTSSSSQDPGDDADPVTVRVRQTVAQLVESRPLSDADRERVAHIFRAVRPS